MASKLRKILARSVAPKGALPLVPEGRSDRSLARSAWDSATPKVPSRRVRSDWRRYAHRLDDWSD
jgi:hypothetical protein